MNPDLAQRVEEGSEHINQIIRDFTEVLTNLQGRIQTKIKFRGERGSMVHLMFCKKKGNEWWLLADQTFTDDQHPFNIYGPEMYQLLDERLAVRVLCVSKFYDLLLEMEQSQERLIASIKEAVEFYDREFGWVAARLAEQRAKKGVK